MNAFVYFFDAAGVLLHSAPLTIPADGLAVLNASTIAALAGKSGSARIAHQRWTGRALRKAVAGARHRVYLRHGDHSRHALRPEGDPQGGGPHTPDVQA
mgnify:CR=1 FL=1